MQTKPDYLQVLIRYQKWRTSYADVPMENPRTISDALNWAIKELSERRRDGPSARSKPRSRG